MRAASTLILVVTLLTMLVPPGAAAQTEEQTKMYVAGGWHGHGRVNEIHHGELIFNVVPGDSITVDIRDVTGIHVAAFVSFHDTKDYDGSFTGGVGSSLGTAKVCHVGMLEVPSGATVLRVVLNSPETADMLGCQPGTATWGTVTVAHAN